MRGYTERETRTFVSREQAAAFRAYLLAVRELKHRAEHGAWLRTMPEIMRDAERFAQTAVIDEAGE